MNKPSLEICTHCWSGDAVPIYHHLLNLQLLSILENKPNDIDVSVMVCLSTNDYRTTSVFNWFYREITVKAIDVRLRRLPLQKSNLFRRAIGRNFVAKATDADVVWFIDGDYLLLRQSLEDATHACLNSDKNMVHPKFVNIHKTHDHGDNLISVMQHRHIITSLNEVDLGEFETRREKRAIGGIQIVKGEWGRQNGYLDKTDWQNSVDPSEGFLSCKSDPHFRKQVGGSETVDIRGVYRLRHSRCGRDDGKVDHGEKTRV